MRLPRWLLIGSAVVGVPALISATFYSLVKLASASQNTEGLSQVGLGAALLLITVGTLLLLRVLRTGWLLKTIAGVAYAGGLVVVSAVIGFVTIVGVPGHFGCSPSETTLRDEFVARRALLEKLLQMSGEDRHVVRIAPTFTRLETNWSWPRPPEQLGFGQGRWDDYRRLFHEAGISDGIERDSGIVFFTVKSCGLSVGGNSFGYAYSPQPPALVNSIETFRGKTGFVPLGSNWYLFASNHD